MLLLKNATFINPFTLDFLKSDIIVEEGYNGKINFFQNPDSSHYQVIDCTGFLVTNSFAVGHHHAYSSLARGMDSPIKKPDNFLEILQHIWWTLDKSLDKDMIEASAYATAIACAKAGSTFIIDHHSSPNFISESLEIISKAFDKVGVSKLLCYEISDRNGTDKSEEALAETENYLKKHQGLVGLHASFTVGDNTLKRAVELMQYYDSGIHIHVAEDKYDQNFTFKQYGKSVVERLNDFGVLNSSKTILGHCLHLSDNEREIVKKSNAWVVQNTDSNLNNNVGYFNSKGLGSRLMLGTDGMHSDMLQSVQQAFFVGQGIENINFFEAYRRFINVHQYIKQNNFEGDGENNLVVLNYQSPTPVTKENFLGHFLFGFKSCDIKHVISKGKLIVKDGILLSVNEEEILNYTREQASRLWLKMKNE